MSFEAAKGEEEVGTRAQRAPAERVEEFATAVLVAAGTDPAAARSVAEALTETSLRGVDSHGIRLLVHYAKVVQTGRINPRPQLTFTRTDRSTGIVDADNGFGHHASLLCHRSRGHACTGIRHFRRFRYQLFPLRIGGMLCAPGGRAGIYSTRGMQLGFVRAPPRRGQAFSRNQPAGFCRSGCWSAAVPDGHGDQRHSLESRAGPDE